MLIGSRSLELPEGSRLATADEKNVVIEDYVAPLDTHLGGQVQHVARLEEVVDQCKRIYLSSPIGDHVCHKEVLVDHKRDISREDLIAPLYRLRAIHLHTVALQDSEEALHLTYHRLLRGIVSP